MSNYALEYADGRVTEVIADTDAEAKAAALGRFGPDAVMFDNWDTAGMNGEGKPRERVLIWDTAADSTDDDGANAIAQLTVVRR